MKVGRSSLLTLSRTVCLVPFFLLSISPHLSLSHPPSLSAPVFPTSIFIINIFSSESCCVHQCLPTVSLFQWFNNSFIQLTMRKAHLTASRVLMEPILGFNIMQLSTQQKKGVSKHSFSLMHFFFLQSFLICAWEYYENLLEIYTQDAFRQILPRPNDPIFMQKVFEKNMRVSI